MFTFYTFLMFYLQTKGILSNRYTYNVQDNITVAIQDYVLFRHLKHAQEGGGVIFALIAAAAQNTPFLHEVPFSA